MVFGLPSIILAHAGNGCACDAFNKVSRLPAETNQDMAEPNIDLTESSGMTENTEDVAWPEQGTSIEQDPSATLGESDETKPV